MTSTGSTRVNYAESARRHFQDACVLQGSGRAANAGQLFGIAAEYGIKAVVVARKVWINKCTPKLKRTGALAARLAGNADQILS